MLSSGMKKYVILFLFNDRIAQQFVVKPRTHVNIERQQRHSDKKLLSFTVRADISVLALDPHDRVILWFHFLPFSQFFFIISHRIGNFKRVKVKISLRQVGGILKYILFYSAVFFARLFKTRTASAKRTRAATHIIAQQRTPPRLAHNPATT